MEDFLSEHFGCYQCDAALRNMKSPTVFIGVEPHREAFRQYTPLVHDGAAQPDMPIDDNVRQYYRVIDAAVADEALKSSSAGNGPSAVRDSAAGAA